MQTGWDFFQNEVLGMKLFNLGKKKKEGKEVPAYCCGVSVDGICCIKVLGAGCKSCHEQFENVKAADVEKLLHKLGC